MSGASAGAAAHAAAINAAKACGVALQVEPYDFLEIVFRNPNALVVIAPAGFLWRKHRYATSYKGFIVHTLSSDPLDLPPKTEVLQAKAMWMPVM